MYRRYTVLVELPLLFLRKATNCMSSVSVWSSTSSGQWHSIEPTHTTEPTTTAVTTCLGLSVMKFCQHLQQLLIDNHRCLVAQTVVAQYRREYIFLHQQQCTAFNIRLFTVNRFFRMQDDDMGNNNMGMSSVKSTRNVKVYSFTCGEQYKSVSISRH